MHPRENDSDQEASTMYRQVFRYRILRALFDDSLSKYRFHRDPDCVSWFVEKLRSLAHRVKKILAACSHRNFVDRTVEDIAQRDTLSRVRKAFRAR